MEAKVPQRIDMEDRVIGPLTLTQFFYLLFGGLFVWLLNSWMVGSLRFFFYPLALLIIIVALAFAFVKIQDRPFMVFVINIFQYIAKPRRRTWQKGEHPKHAQIIPDPAKADSGPVKKVLDRARLEKTAEILDKADNGQQ